MTRNIIKLRAICTFGSDRIGIDYIRYDDEVPDDTHVWKATRRHNDESIVEIGEIWSNPIDDMSEPCWNAYAILDGKASMDEIMAKSKELHAKCKEWMKHDMDRFIGSIASFSLDSEALADRIKRYEE